MIDALAGIEVRGPAGGGGGTEGRHGVHGVTGGTERACRWVAVGLETQGGP